MEDRQPLEGGYKDDGSISLTSVSDGTVYSAFSETEQLLSDKLSPGGGEEEEEEAGTFDGLEVRDSPPFPSSSLTPTAMSGIAAAKRKRGRPRAPDANKKLAALEALFSEPAIPTRRKPVSAPATGRLSPTTRTLPLPDVYDPLIEEFHRACQYGQIGLIESLLKKQGISANLPRLDTGDTSLHLAANHQQSEAVKTLLKAGANVRALNSLGHQPRELCPPGSVTYRLLVDFEEMQTGSEASSTSRDGVQLLGATWRGQEARVREILRTGKVNPNITDLISGSSGLHYAAVWNYASLIELLLSRGANPNLQRPRDGATALHLACRFSSGDAARALLEGKAAWDTLDCLGRTPVDYSSKSVRRIIRKYAREHLKGQEAHRLLDATATQRFIEVSADDEGEGEASSSGGGAVAGSERSAERLSDHHAHLSSLPVLAEAMSAREEKKLLQMMAIISKSDSGASLVARRKRGRPPRHHTHSAGSTGEEPKDGLRGGADGKGDTETDVEHDHDGADANEDGFRRRAKDKNSHGHKHKEGERRGESEDTEEEEGEEGAGSLINDAAGTLSASSKVRQSPRHRAAARTLTSLFDDAQSMVSGVSSTLLREIEAMEPLLQLHCGGVHEEVSVATITVDTHSLWFFLAPQVEDLYSKSFPGRDRLRSRIPLSKTRPLTESEQQVLLDASLVDKFVGLRAHLEGPLGSLSLLERDAVLAQFERAGGNLANVPIIYVDLPRLAHRDEGPSPAGSARMVVGEAGALPPKLKLKYKQRRSIVDLYT